MARKPFDPGLVPSADGAGAPSPAGGWLTVTQLTRRVKSALAERLPPRLHVVGQISNFKRHTSGHWYFVLKDAHSELSCVMWRSATPGVRFRPEDGVEVVATGHVDVFERTGRYQLYARKLEPVGVGALELAFRQLREKLAKEGLFEPDRKRPIPTFPRRVAIVTSKTGAAIRDMLQTMGRRYPCVEVMVYPVRVQGPEAAGEIARAIDLLNRNRARLGGLDVMIVGRGGGSIEDLWAFNEEAVARAVFASEIPIVSAVGHETDVTICDLVADVRAATPTAAAELVTPDRAGLIERVDRIGDRMRRDLGHAVAVGRSRLEALTSRRAFGEPAWIVNTRMLVVDEWARRIADGMSRRVAELHRRLGRHEAMVQRIRPDVFVVRMQKRLGDFVHRLAQAARRGVRRAERRSDAFVHRFRADAVERVRVGERRLAAVTARLAGGHPVHRVMRCADRVEQLSRRLEATSHQATLGRGFSITRLKKSGALVRAADVVQDGDVVLTETAGGAFESRVVNRRQNELFD